MEYVRVKDIKLVNSKLFHRSSYISTIVEQMVKEILYCLTFTGSCSWLVSYFLSLDLHKSIINVGSALPSIVAEHLGGYLSECFNYVRSTVSITNTTLLPLSFTGLNPCMSELTPLIFFLKLYFIFYKPMTLKHICICI